MKVFHCGHCDHLLFYENTKCVQCGHELAYLPDIAILASLDPIGDGTWRAMLPGAGGRTYRLCRNYTDEQVCNWAVRADETNPLCVSCRLTRVIPDLAPQGNRQAWSRLEVAKRQLIFTLMQLGLPVVTREEDPKHGLAFEFKADAPDGSAPVLTGQSAGVITINLAEADDVERERRRKAVQEPYRTLLGHVRHESGHYYWDRLIKESPSIDEFRKLFGDERGDYGIALQTHYEAGAPPDWQDRFITAYASAHPWEDWAETWAHYLHMVDALETAAASGLSLSPQRANEPSMPKIAAATDALPLLFEEAIERWFPLTYVLNNFSRSLGLPDAYPFVLSSPAIAKLQCVHETIVRAAQTRVAAPPSVHIGNDIGRVTV
jgi:hypothetical protein